MTYDLDSVACEAAYQSWVAHGMPFGAGGRDTAYDAGVAAAEAVLTPIRELVAMWSAKPRGWLSTEARQILDELKALAG